MTELSTNFDSKELTSLQLSNKERKILVLMLRGEEITRIGRGCYKVHNFYLTITLLHTLSSKSLLIRRSNQWVLSEYGRFVGQYLVHITIAKKSANKFSEQHQLIESRTIMTSTGPQKVSINVAETPIGWLSRRRDNKGKQLLSESQINAAEKFRRDYELSGLVRSTTINYDKFGSGSSSYFKDSYGNLSNTQLDAKARVDAAIDAVGPVLSDSLVRVCCFLEGLEQTERSMAWPSRSAKLILSIALDRLAEHYLTK